MTVYQFTAIPLEIFDALPVWNIGRGMMASANEYRIKDLFGEGSVILSCLNKPFIVKDWSDRQDSVMETNKRI